MRIVDETVWLTQTQLCELYQTGKSNVSEHIKHIFEDGELELYNFSIVNGGQTTNLIGRTNFDNDFPIMCKVIKNKYLKYQEE